MKKLILLLGLFINFSPLAWSNTVSGKITSPNTIGVISNGTLTLTLNQSAIVAGSFSITTSPVACYTSTDGSIVGLPNPLAAPVVAASQSSGSLSGTYYVKITYWTASLETLASPAFTVTVTMPSNQFTVSGPVLQPVGATGYKIYVGTTLGAETLQTTVTGWGSTLITSVSGGSALPSTNSTLCAVQFNDSMIPFGTWYGVSLVDSNGSAVGGFPQRWYLSGNSVDVTNGYPLASVTNALRFPTPILANPSSNALQSMNSPLTLNGYALTSGSVVLPDNGAPPACSAGRAVIWEDSSTHLLKGCQNGTTAQNLLSAIVNGWAQNGTDIREATSSNSVLIGLNNSDLTGQGGGANNGVSVGTFSFWVDATTNAHGLEAGIVASSPFAGGGPAAIFGNIASGTQTAGSPLIFVGCLDIAHCATGGYTEYGRLDVGGEWHLGSRASGASEDTFAGAVHIRGGLTISNGLTNAQTLTISTTGGGSGKSDLAAGFTGTGAYKPLSFTTSGSESCRIDITHNFMCGTTTDDDATQNLAEFVRTNTSGSSVGVWNSGNGTTAYGSVFVKAGTTYATAPTMAIGVDAPGWSTAGAYSANMGFIQSNSAATSGLLIDAIAGQIVLRANGTSEVTVVGGTGVALAHALPVSSGGTGVTSTPTVNGIVRASSTTALAASPTFLWDESNKWATLTGNVVVKSSTANYPPGGTALANLYYDSAADGTFLVSANYTGPTYKPLTLGASQIAININGTDSIWITSNGPKFLGSNSIAVSAGAYSLSMASTSFPGISGASAIPYRWLRAVAEDGTVVYIPAWK